MNGDRSARILVVDDVPGNVRLLEAVLESRGYEGPLRPATAVQLWSWSSRRLPI